MNRYFMKKAVVAICFVTILAVGFILNVSKLSLTVDFSAGMETVLANAEASINDQTFGKYAFLDVFGALQNVMGKDEVNDFEVVRDEQGFLHYTYFAEGAKSTNELVESLNLFRNGIQNDKTKLLYLMTPDKYIPGYTTFSKGIPYSYSNETADGFLEGLAQYEIPYLDFRDYLAESGIQNTELFYKTDHHWKIETSFWAFTKLLEELQNQYGFHADNYEEVTDLSNYNQYTYPQSFAGSMARKNGIFYSGADDFTLIYPKFQTDYKYKAVTGSSVIETSGRFEHALLSMVPFVYKGSQYDIQADKYASYLFGNQGIAHIQNTSIDGPNVLIVKDSFMIPVASFLSTVCSDIYMVDTRYYEENILEYTNSIDDLDYVFVSYTPQDLTQEFFQFQK